MATKTSTAVTNTTLPRSNIGVNAMDVTYNFGGVLGSAGDVIQMLPISLGTKIISIEVAGGSVATNGVVRHVGDGDDADRYDRGRTGSLSSVFTLCNQPAGVGYTYTKDDTVDITLATVTSATVTGSLHMRMTYIAP